MSNFYFEGDVLTVRGAGLAPDTIEEALDLSVEKWETITGFCEEQGGKLDMGGTGEDTCGLCVMLRNKRERYDHCPVKWYTGVHYCGMTPYGDFIEGPSTENARREVEFLRMVRDKYLAGELGERD